MRKGCVNSNTRRAVKQIRDQYQIGVSYRYNYKTAMLQLFLQRSRRELGLECLHSTGQMGCYFSDFYTFNQVDEIIEYIFY